jgi:hypothetical protein
MAGAIERLVQTMQLHNVFINEEETNFVDVHTNIEFEDVIYSIAYTEES